MLTSNDSHMKGLTVSVPEFARFIGSIPTQVTHWIAEGMPVFERGSRGKSHVLNSADCYHWLINRAKSVKLGHPKEKDGDNDAKNRAAVARADALEFDLAMKRGDYILIKDVSPILSEQMIEARTILQQVGQNAREQFGSDVARFFETELSTAFERIKNIKQPLTIRQIEEFQNERR